MDPITIALVGGLGLGLINTISSNVWAGKNNKRANENFDLEEENFDYQKALQQKIFDREDTAIQRRMLDAQEAGLNPYSVLNLGGANAGSVVKTEAPQKQMLQNALQINGVLDFLNSGMDVMSRIQQTKNERADYEIKDLERRILNIQLDDYALGNFNHRLDTWRAIDEYNYDFNRNISKDLGHFGGSDFYGYNEVKYPYNYDYIGDAYSWNKSLDRKLKARDVDIKNLEWNMMNMDWQNYDDVIKTRQAQREYAQFQASLMGKQNDSYYFDKGVDLVSGILDNVWRGISAFTGLGNLNVGRRNSSTNWYNAETNRMNAVTNRMKSVSEGRYRGKNWYY